MMAEAPSLRRRLVVLVGGGVILLLLAAYLSTAMVLEERQDDMIDAILDEQMAYSLQLYHSLGHAPVLNVPHMRFYAHARGDVAAAGMPVAFAGLGLGDHELDVDGVPYHLEVVDAGGQRFVLAYDASGHERDFAELMVILGVAFLASAVVAVAGIAWLSRHALAHLERLAGAVRDPGEGALVEPGMEREVAALAAALDDYRARQALLLAREQEFSAQLSHELRTPLSVVRAQAELLQMSVPDARGRERAAGIMAQVDRMGGLIEQLLRLARRTRAPERQPLPLRELVERIWSELALGGSSRTMLDNRVAADATVVADPLLLELVLRNALANARLHADGATLQVRCSGDVLEIEDSNAARDGVAPWSGAGEGLGLSILRQACQRLGWGCTIAATATGTCLTLRLA